MGIFERIQSFNEKKAYENLKSYDQGVYRPKRYPSIDKDLKIEDFEEKTKLNLNERLLKEYVEHGRVLNTRHSDFQPGNFVEKSNYEASFAKKVYCSSELEFLIELFISHNNIHSFSDGNKRTALNYFLDLINKYTKFFIKDILSIQDAQIHYLTKDINEDEFKNIILNEVEVKMVKRNTKVHLEHLIPRVELEDEVGEQNITPSERKSSFTLSDLEDNAFFYTQLKKPYFQRDTNEWSVERVQKLLETFLEDGLIPAIIMWESNEGDLLIIDGGHRVSSLIAWIHDDFGKNDINSMTSDKALSEYFNLNIGNYKEIKSSKNEEYKRIKSIIAKKSIPIQWVIGGYEKVKESFIRINEQGVSLSNDEKELIENDKLPTSRLARAILSHGSGQSSSYSNKKTKIIYDYFFVPMYIKDHNIYPMLGAVDDEFVISRVYNVIKIIDDYCHEDLESLTNKVIEFCKFFHNDLQICCKSYFYGANQRFKTSSLFGFTKFSMELHKNKELLEKYLKNRGEFEKYITDNERNIQEISRKRRQSSKSIDDICNYYRVVLDAIDNKKYDLVYQSFSYLQKSENNLTERQNVIADKYHTFLDKIPKCDVCGGFIDGYSTENQNIHNCCKE